MLALMAALLARTLDAQEGVWEQAMVASWRWGRQKPAPLQQHAKESRQ